MTGFALQVEELSKTFPGKNPVEALRKISFSLRKGEILGILGPNGAGKTTVIRILISVLKPSSGRALIMGHDLAVSRSEALANVGYASTYTNLPYFLTVEQNLDIHGRFYGLTKRERGSRITDLLDRFGVADLRKRRISQLSAGQRTRMMLIKALLPNPPILLLDEPTASLDIEIAEEVRNYILEERKRRELSVLFTSHNMEEVSSLCDRVIFLSSGRIIAEDTPRHLARSAANSLIHLTAQGEPSAIQHIAAQRGLAIEPEGDGFQVHCPEVEVAPLVTEIVKAGVELSELRIDHPTLKDFFMKFANEKRR